MTNRGVTQKSEVQRSRLILDAGSAPVLAPLVIIPSAAPTGDVRAGSIYLDSTSNALKIHNGTSFTNTTTIRPTYSTTTVLTAADSGAHCIFSVTTVTTFTLPAAATGLHFKFSCGATAAGTADIFRIVCTSGDFFLGSFIQSTDGTYTTAAHAANGTTHLAWEGNGSTTGGLAGDWLEVTAISGTQWAVYGFGRATGTEATPWKTS